MCTTEVTQAQWKAVMGTAPWAGKAHAREGDTCAASYLSWSDASDFCRKLSAKAGKTVRLPTESEWEYACRAGTSRAYHFGNDSKQLGRYAWYGDNADSKGEGYAHEVGRKQPNPWGLYDLYGNVWEWCRDWFKMSYPTDSIQVDPSGPATGRSRVLRGGSYGSHPAYCRSASRANDQPDFGWYGSGFRVVVPASDSPR